MASQGPLSLACFQGHASKHNTDYCNIKYTWRMCKSACNISHDRICTDVLSKIHIMMKWQIDHTCTINYLPATAWKAMRRTITSDTVACQLKKCPARFLSQSRFPKVLKVIIRHFHLMLFEG